MYRKLSEMALLAFNLSFKNEHQCSGALALKVLQHTKSTLNDSKCDYVLDYFLTQRT